jgi:chromosome segregation ATPase
MSDELKILIEGLRDDIKVVAEGVMTINTKFDQHSEENRQEFGEIRSDIQGLQADMVIVRGDVQELKTDMVTVKRDVQELKSDVRDLKSDTSSIRQDLNDHRTNTELHTVKSKGHVV